ncbi:MAG: methyltransferase domain-containing protein [Neisseriaceae bacterium]|nr:methyltransferase domain-containing protein [Neisseriaceae bacterium]MBP6863406.1 methyltransferase domain-containing protein [Neisseriaceae bacterium]
MSAASMSATAYKTRQQSVQVNNNLLFTIHSLLNQQQFYDPEQKAERLGICSAAWPLFGMLWPSSIQLALKIIKRPIAPHSKLLEIGCGLGIASLTARLMGHDITASDRHPLAGHFLNVNAKLNHLPTIRFKHGQWGDVPTPSIEDTNAPLLSGQYDHIMASDVLYEPCSAVQVAAFIHRFAEPDCTVWVVDPNRGYHNQLTREMARYDFNLAEHSRLTDPVNHQPYRGRLLVYERGSV